MEAVRKGSVTQMNQSHLKFICAALQLGSPEGAPTSVQGCRGGSFMWQVHTEKAAYAIKQLAPVIDLKSESIVTKYELSETISYRFAQLGIPAVSAIKQSGKHLIIIENIGYLVYPWIEGYTLGRDEISETHAIKIAEIVARLHTINLSVPEIEAPRFDIHSNDKISAAIDKSVSLKCPFAKTLKENKNFILSANESYQAVIPLLRQESVVSHGDVNQLNVLWDKTNQPILVDWESARKLNPTREIVGTSLAWSGMTTENFSLPIYNRMLRTHIKSCGSLNKLQVEATLQGLFGSPINWLLYNIELACTSDVQKEKDIAIKEVNGTLMTMIRCKRLIPDLLKIFT
jgi:thiamine kinase-like enzyme